MKNRLLFAFGDRIGVFRINMKLLRYVAIVCWFGMSLFAMSVGFAAPVVPAASASTIAVNPAPPVIGSETAILMVAGTKQILYEKDSHKIMYPASTTKMMTLITAMKRAKLDETVVVAPAAVGIEGSSLELRMLDRLSLRELLFGLMLASGNDAAHAVAEHVGRGSYKQFIAWMNEDAEKIGAIRTHFSNPHGLPDPINHFTTAYDLAMIADAGFKIAGFEQFVAQPYHTVMFQNRAKGIPLVNTNTLLMTYSGANGVKTGVTRAAGRCLVASARRNGVLLIAVVLNGGDSRFKDSAALLDYGFRRLAK